MSDQETDFTDEFDGPVIEAVRGMGDVKFARADMDYWAEWARGLKAKRTQQLRAEIEKQQGIDPIAKARALSDAQSPNVQIFELLDQQFTPDGIDKITRDAFVRAGGESARWTTVRKRIGPLRLQKIAHEICSEPRPQVDEIREALRKALAGRVSSNVDAMSTDDLLRASKEIGERAGTQLPLEESGGKDSTSSLPG